jgi:RNase P/RNase MRP subunit p29
MINIKYLDNIGKDIKIENSSDISKIGLVGKVIFESKNILVLRDKNNNIKKIKKSEILKFKKI